MSEKPTVVDAVQMSFVAALATFVVDNPGRVEPNLFTALGMLSAFGVNVGRLGAQIGNAEVEQYGIGMIRAAEIILGRCATVSETISMEYLANLSARLAKAEAQVQAVRQLREQWPPGRSRTPSSRCTRNWGVRWGVVLDEGP